MRLFRVYVKDPTVVSKAYTYRDFGAETIEAALEMAQSLSGAEGSFVVGVSDLTYMRKMQINTGQSSLPAPHQNGQFTLRPKQRYGPPLEVDYVHPATPPPTVRTAKSVFPIPKPTLESALQQCPLCKKYVPQKGFLRHIEYHGRVLSKGNAIRQYTSRRENLNQGPLVKCDECGKDVPQNKLKMHKNGHANTANLMAHRERIAAQKTQQQPPPAAAQP